MDNLAARVRGTNSLAVGVVGGLLAASLYHFGWGSWQGWEYPANTFLFRPSDRFMDLVNTIQRAKVSNPYEPSASPVVPNYFPWTYLMLRPLGAWPEMPVAWGFVSLNVMGLIVLAVQWARRIFPAPDEIFAPQRLTWTLAALFLLNYPTIFALDRGNLDLLVQTLALAGFLGWSRQRRLVPIVAWGCAIALKGYPAYLLALFIFRRRYTDAVVCLYAGRRADSAGVGGISLWERCCLERLAGRAWEVLGDLPHQV